MKKSYKETRARALVSLSDFSPPSVHKSYILNRTINKLYLYFFLFFLFFFFFFFLFFFNFSFFFFFFFSSFFLLFFFFIFFFFSSEFRERNRSFSELRTCRPGSARSFLRTLDLLNKGSALSFVRTPNLRGFGVLEKDLAFLRTLHSEPAKPGFGLVFSRNSKHVRVRSWQKRTGLSPNSKPAKPGLYPVLSAIYDPAEPGLTWFNS